MLWDYVDEIKRSNSNIKVVDKTCPLPHDYPHRFLRMYIYINVVSNIGPKEVNTKGNGIKVNCDQWKDLFPIFLRSYHRLK